MSMARSLVEAHLSRVDQSLSWRSPTVCTAAGSTSSLPATKSLARRSRARFQAADPLADGDLA